MIAFLFYYDNVSAKVGAVERTMDNEERVTISMEEVSSQEVTEEQANNGTALVLPNEISEQAESIEETEDVNVQEELDALETTEALEEAELVEEAVAVEETETTEETEATEEIEETEETLEELSAKLSEVEGELEALQEEIEKGSLLEDEEISLKPELGDSEETLATKKEIAKLVKDAEKAKDKAEKLHAELVHDRLETQLLLDEKIDFSPLEEAEEIENDDTPEEPEEEDTPERAFEVGVSNEFDNYDREILSAVFENKLRMCKNRVKYYYSKLKNLIMSYADVKQKFDGVFEIFRYNRKIILRFGVNDGALYVYCALDPKSIDNKVYPHKIAKGEHAKQTPTLIVVNDDDALVTASEVVALVMSAKGIEKRNAYVLVAYAERYSFIPNAVLSGNEDKAPVDGEFDDEIDYGPIYGEISTGSIDETLGLHPEEKEKKPKKVGKALLEELRQKATTIKAAVAMTEPIVYFYDAAIDKDSAVEYVNIQQVLNDKFLGKIIPQMYFAVAEGSERIEDFNFLSIKETVKACNENPKHKFCIAVSCRLLIKPHVFERLMKYTKTENGNLILAFDCALLEALGNIGLENIRRLRDENGVNIMLDNAENAGMKVLTEYDYEYLRFDSRYYGGGDARKRAHLMMLTGYAKSQNIKTTSININNGKEAKVLVDNGVDILQGYGICEPKRQLHLALKGIKTLVL